MPQLTADEIGRRSGLLIDSFCLLYFTAPNDRNANPQRLWALFSPAGQLLAAWNEGYGGTHSLPAAVRPKAATCHAIAVSAATYRALLRQARHLMEI